MELSVPARAGLAGLGFAVVGVLFVVLALGADDAAMLWVYAAIMFAVAVYALGFWWRMRRHVGRADERRPPGAPRPEPATSALALAVLGAVVTAMGVLSFVTDDDPTGTARRTPVPEWLLYSLVIGFGLALLGWAARTAAARRAPSAAAGSAASGADR